MRPPSAIASNAACPECGVDEPVHAVRRGLEDSLGHVAAPGHHDVRAEVPDQRFIAGFGISDYPQTVSLR
jgi:hypothetical protein